MAWFASLASQTAFQLFGTTAGITSCAWAPPPSADAKTSGYEGTVFGQLQFEKLWVMLPRDRQKYLLKEFCSGPGETMPGDTDTVPGAAQGAPPKSLVDRQKRLASAVVEDFCNTYPDEMDEAEATSCAEKVTPFVQVHPATNEIDEKLWDFYTSSERQKNYIQQLFTKMYRNPSAREGDAGDHPFWISAETKKKLHAGLHLDAYLTQKETEWKARAIPTLSEGCFERRLRDCFQGNLQEGSVFLRTRTPYRELVSALQDDEHEHNHVSREMNQLAYEDELKGYYVRFLDEFWQAFNQLSTKAQVDQWSRDKTDLDLTDLPHGKDLEDKMVRLEASFDTHWNQFCALHKESFIEARKANPAAASPSSARSSSSCEKANPRLVVSVGTRTPTTHQPEGAPPDSFPEFQYVELLEETSDWVARFLKLENWPAAERPTATSNSGMGQEDDVDPNSEALAPDVLSTALQIFQEQDSTQQSQLLGELQHERKLQVSEFYASNGPGQAPPKWNSLDDMVAWLVFRLLLPFNPKIVQDAQMVLRELGIKTQDGPPSSSMQKSKMSAMFEQKYGNLNGGGAPLVDTQSPCRIAIERIVNEDRTRSWEGSWNGPTGKWIMLYDLISAVDMLPTALTVLAQAEAGQKGLLEHVPPDLPIALERANINIRNFRWDDITADQAYELLEYAYFTPLRRNFGHNTIEDNIEAPGGMEASADSTPEEPVQPKRTGAPAAADVVAGGAGAGAGRREVQVGVGVVDAEIEKFVEKWLTKAQQEAAQKLSSAEEQYTFQWGCFCALYFHQAEDEKNKCRQSRQDKNVKMMKQFARQVVTDRSGCDSDAACRRAFLNPLWFEAFLDPNGFWNGQSAQDATHLGGVLLGDLLKVPVPATSVWRTSLGFVPTEEALVDPPKEAERHKVRRLWSFKELATRQERERTSPNLDQRFHLWNDAAKWLVLKPLDWDEEAAKTPAATEVSAELLAVIRRENGLIHGEYFPGSPRFYTVEDQNKADSSWSLLTKHQQGEVQFVCNKYTEQGNEMCRRPDEANPSAPQNGLALLIYERFCSLHFSDHVEVGNGDDGGVRRATNENCAEVFARSDAANKQTFTNRVKTKHWVQEFLHPEKYLPTAEDVPGVAGLTWASGQKPQSTSVMGASIMSLVLGMSSSSNNEAEEKAKHEEILGKWDDLSDSGLDQGIIDAVNAMEFENLDARFAEFREMIEATHSRLSQAQQEQETPFGLSPDPLAAGGSAAGAPPPPPSVVRLQFPLKEDLDVNLVAGPEGIAHPPCERYRNVLGWFLDPTHSESTFAIQQALTKIPGLPRASVDQEQLWQNFCRAELEQIQNVFEEFQGPRVRLSALSDLLGDPLLGRIHALEEELRRLSSVSGNTGIAGGGMMQGGGPASSGGALAGPQDQRQRLERGTLVTVGDVVDGTPNGVGTTFPKAPQPGEGLLLSHGRHLQSDRLPDEHNAGVLESTSPCGQLSTLIYSSVQRGEEPALLQFSDVFQRFSDLPLMLATLATVTPEWSQRFCEAHSDRIWSVFTEITSATAPSGDEQFLLASAKKIEDALLSLWNRASSELERSTHLPGMPPEVAKAFFVSSPSADETMDVVLSVADFHGDLTAAREALVLAGVLEAASGVTWIGGRRTLICTGDIVDRGPDGREIYDLIFDLQEKAERVGGKVIFLLGNHEMFRLRYLEMTPGFGHPVGQYLSEAVTKEPESSWATSRPPSSVQSISAENANPDPFTGSWAPRADYGEAWGPGGWLFEKLRTRADSMVVVGRTLYMHASISNAVMDHVLRVAVESQARTMRGTVVNSASVAEIENEIMQNPKFRDDVLRAVHEDLFSLVETSTSQDLDGLDVMDGDPALEGKAVYYQNPNLRTPSPFWGRSTHGLPGEQPPDCSEVDAALQFFGVDRIVNGHSIQPQGKAELRCEGKIILADIAMSTAYQNPYSGGANPQANVAVVAVAWPRDQPASGNTVVRAAYFSRKTGLTEVVKQQVGTDLWELIQKVGLSRTTSPATASGAGAFTGSTVTEQMQNINAPDGGFLLSHGLDTATSHLGGGDLDPHTGLQAVAGGSMIPHALPAVGWGGLQGGEYGLQPPAPALPAQHEHDLDAGGLQHLHAQDPAFLAAAQGTSSSFPASLGPHDAGGGGAAPLDAVGGTATGGPLLQEGPLPRPRSGGVPFGNPAGAAAGPPPPHAVANAGRPVVEEVDPATLVGSEATNLHKWQRSALHAKVQKLLHGRENVAVVNPETGQELLGQDEPHAVLAPGKQPVWVPMIIGEVDPEEYDQLEANQEHDKLHGLAFLPDPRYEGHYNSDEQEHQQDQLQDGEQLQRPEHDQDVEPAPLRTVVNTWKAFDVNSPATPPLFSGWEVFMLDGVHHADPKLGHLRLIIIDKTVRDMKRFKNKNWHIQDLQAFPNDVSSLAMWVNGYALFQRPDQHALVMDGFGIWDR
ncbi:unnamed protein product [Amoebophrya sp. A120]|nr:unnamed protein product [Amoebophrya sp. A120]|eukprot:GSA120T00014286001.1